MYGADTIVDRVQRHVLQAGTPSARVCEGERETEREKQRDRDRERKIKRERERDLAPPSALENISLPFSRHA
eukprot:COSAG03_NODE_4246_length_1623_cov_46.219816_3_plen_72_part_00